MLVNAGPSLISAISQLFCKAERNGSGNSDSEPHKTQLYEVWINSAQCFRRRCRFLP